MLRQPTSDLQAYGNWTRTPGSRHTVGYDHPAIDNLSVGVAARQNSGPINPKTGAVWTVSEIEGSDPDSSLQGFGVVSTDAIPDAQLACIRLRVEYTASAVLSVTSAPLTLTGQAFAIKLNRKLTVTSAGLTLTGKNIEFLMESRMVVEP